MNRKTQCTMAPTQWSDDIMRVAGVGGQRRLKTIRWSTLWGKPMFVQFFRLMMNVFASQSTSQRHLSYVKKHVTMQVKTPDIRLPKLVLCTPVSYFIQSIRQLSIIFKAVYNSQKRRMTYESVRSRLQLFVAFLQPPWSKQK